MMDYKIDQDLYPQCRLTYAKQMIKLEGRQHLGNYKMVQFFDRLRACVFKDINWMKKQYIACEQKLKQLEEQKKKITQDTNKYVWPDNKDLENDPKKILGPLASLGEEQEKLALHNMMLLVQNNKEYDTAKLLQFKKVEALFPEDNQE